MPHAMLLIKLVRLAGGDHPGAAADSRGVGLVGEEGLEMEKSRGADDLVVQLSQALNRLRAMVSLPKYSRKCRGLRPATADRWRDRVLTSQPFSRSRRVYRSQSFNSGSGPYQE
jgi:hypothetical protein